MLTESEFKKLSKTIKSKKLTVGQILDLIETSYTMGGHTNVRDKTTFVHKINAPSSPDLTREREKKLGVKVMTEGESQRVDDSRKR